VKRLLPTYDCFQGRHAAGVRFAP